MSAREVLQAAVVAAVRQVAGLAVFDCPPVRGAVPFVVVEDPVLADWSTKTWAGHEARLAVVFTDAGERPVRLRRMMGAAEDAVAAMPVALGGGWRLAGVRLARSRIARSGERWLGASEFVARMMREDG